jgi:hypothetical protein
VAGGRFAPGHLGELTQQVPFEMAGAVLEQTCRVQHRVRNLPARVVVYLLLAGRLFAELGYGQVWRRLAAGLGGLPVAAPTASAMTQARRRLRPGPLRELFSLLRGPSPQSARWKGLLVCAVDGTIMAVADSPENLAVYAKQRGGANGGGSYPTLRLLALVSCGTRTVIDAVFRPVSDGETTCARLLLRSLDAGMILLADRNFAAGFLAAQAAAARAEFLIRARTGRGGPGFVVRRLPDGSWLSRFGGVPVRVIDAEITAVTATGRTAGRYRLVTTLTGLAQKTAICLSTHREAVGELYPLTLRCPDEIELWAALGIALYRSRRPGEADVVLRQAVSLLFNPCFPCCPEVLVLPGVSW